MSIQEHLNKIRNAIYGREVRESIAKGIETAYDDASENGNANMEVKIARGTHPNLRSRLEEVDNKQQQTTAQLAQTNSEKVGGGVKAELEDLSPDVLSAIEGGEGTSFELLSIPQDKSVTPQKTTFVKTKNLFDGVYTKGASLTGPELAFSTSYPESISVIKKIEPNTTYTISKASDSDRFTIGTFLEYPINNMASNRVIKIDGSNVPTTFTSTANEQYVVVYVSTSTASKEPSWLQIEYGSIATEHDEVAIKLSSESFENIKLPNRIVTPEKTTFAKTKNLFNGAYTRDYSLTGSDDLTFEYIQGAISAIHKIDPGVTYTISKSYDTNRFVVGSFSEYPVHGADAKRAIKVANFNQPVTFTAEENEKYIVIYVSTSSESKEPEWLQLEIGDEATPPNEIDINLSKESLKNFDLSITDEYIVINQTKENYTNTMAFEPFTREKGDDILFDLYNQWDEMVTHDPNYVSKNLEGHEATGLPIYSYEFKPKVPQGNPSNLKHPKIIHVGGIHGMERFCNYEDLRFFKDLVYNWKENDVLGMLRSNLHIVVVPVLNPWGFANLERGNSNGVDLNRNYGKNFKQTAEGPYYSGTHALSEVESQIMDALIERHEDAILGIDHHNYNTLASDGHIAYFGSRNEIERVTFSLASFLDSHVKIKVPSLIEDDPENDARNLFMTMNHNTPQGLANHFTEKGIVGVLFETIGGSWGTGYSESQETLQDVLVDVLGNLISTVLIHNKQFK